MSVVKGKMDSEVRARFMHYPPRDQKEIQTHESIRVICRSAALNLIEIMPESVLSTREFSQVLTDLENAMMHANAAFARNKPIVSETNPKLDKKPS